MLSEQMTEAQVNDAAALREVFKLNPATAAAFARILQKMNRDAVDAYLSQNSKVRKSQLTGYRAALDDLSTTLEQTIKDGETAVAEEREFAATLRSETLGCGSNDL